MSLHKYIERVKYIDYLIHKKATGNINVLAKKLNLSKSGTEKFIHEMKEIGFPIIYSKKQETYLYEHEGKMVDKLFFEELDNPEMKNINDGKNVLSALQFFPDRNYSRF